MARLTWLRRSSIVLAVLMGGLGFRRASFASLKLRSWTRVENDIMCGVTALFTLLKELLVMYEKSLVL